MLRRLQLLIEVWCEAWCELTGGHHLSIAEAWALENRGVSHVRWYCLRCGKLTPWFRLRQFAPKDDE